MFSGVCNVTWFAYLPMECDKIPHLSDSYVNIDNTVQKGRCTYVWDLDDEKPF